MANKHTKQDSAEMQGAGDEQVVESTRVYPRWLVKTVSAVSFTLSILFIVTMILGSLGLVWFGVDYLIDKIF